MSIESNKELWSGWETTKLLGRGSFGAVYEIERRMFDDVEKAALKVISIPQNDSDIDELYGEGYDEESITSTLQNHLRSIIAEYTLMRKMNGSSNVVSCDDIRYEQHDDGIGWDVFIKMELLTPLMKSLSSDISEDVVFKVAKDMCRALELCKKYDIVHRDIKPQNIFLSPNGDYKLGDFGIAKTVEKTIGGTKIGTYKYMAPEVYNNQPYGTAADIYSLGLVLYWMLNERRMPFMPLPPQKVKPGMEEEARYRRFMGEEIPPPAHGSERLRKIVLKACAYDPADRYSSAAEMLKDLNGETEKEVSLYRPVVIEEQKPLAVVEDRKEMKVESPKLQQPEVIDDKKEDVIIKFRDREGLLLESKSYTFGSSIIPPYVGSEEEEGVIYEFLRWAPDIPKTATKDMEFRAMYRRGEKKKEDKLDTADNLTEIFSPQFVLKCIAGVVAVLTVVGIVLWNVWDGWINLGDKKYYLEDGSLLEGWKLIDNSMYYFDSDYQMVTGKQYILNTWYDFGEQGQVKYTWKLIDENMYYFGNDGSMVIGWQTISGFKHYFESTGVMCKGWKTISGEKYYFDKDGRMLIGKHTIDGNEYMFALDGALMDTYTNN